MVLESIDAIIVDDEKKGIDALVWKISQLNSQINIIQEFTNPEKAIIYCLSHKIDLVFLDIDMPEINGLEFIGKLKSLNRIPTVIFVTGHEEYVLEALRNSAFDYLLKPVDLDELRDTLERFIEERKFENRTKSNSQEKNKIALPTSENIIYLDSDEIKYCASDSNYTMIHLEDDKKMMIARTLGKVELLLDHCFIRIHHSYIVNKEKISSYQRGSGGSVKLHDGTILPVSKNRKDELLRRMV